MTTGEGPNEYIDVCRVSNGPLNRIDSYDTTNSEGEVHQKTGVFSETNHYRYKVLPFGVILSCQFGDEPSANYYSVVGFV